MKVKMRDRILLRPHHVLCIHFYEGLGYDDEFNKNMKKIVDMVLPDGKLTIEIVCTVDDICSKCPQNVEGRCATEVSVKRKDLSALAFLGLNEGACLSSKELSSLARMRIATLRDVDDVCGECPWSNVCNRHLKH